MIDSPPEIGSIPGMYPSNLLLLGAMPSRCQFYNNYKLHLSISLARIHHSHPLSLRGTPDMTAYYVNNPYHLDIRCNRNTTGKSFFNRDTIETLSVNAGDKLGASTDNETFTNILHPGPGLSYLAKEPDGIDLKDWDGDGNWFKIGELGLRGGQKNEWAVRTLVDTKVQKISCSLERFVDQSC